MDDSIESASAAPKAKATAADDPWGILGREEDSWFFCLRLLGERYAFEASLALEVIRLGLLTRLPAAPSFLPGVFHHRGQVLASLDLGQFIADRPTSLAHGSRCVIVECGGWKLALLAEAIEGLVRIPKESLEPPPSVGTTASALLAQVGRDEAGPVAILDLPRVIEAARARSART